MKKLMAIAILLVVAMAVLNLTYQEPYKHDAEFPMANTNVRFSYTQSKNPR